jgi:hypothetical protein
VPEHSLALAALDHATEPMKQTCRQLQDDGLGMFGVVVRSSRARRVWETLGLWRRKSTWVATSARIASSGFPAVTITSVPRVERPVTIRWRTAFVELLLAAEVVVEEGRG